MTTPVPGTEMRRQIIAATVAVSLLLTAAACKKSDNSNASRQGSGVSAKGGAAGSSDSLVIRTTDGTMNLGLARDTIFMGLTDSVLTLAREDMARDTQETGSAIAGTIERFVKKKVSSALGTRLTYPVTDIDSASYRNGSIKFAYRERRRMAFEDVSQNGHKALASFSPEDAQRFVATVNSAIHSRRGNQR
jgi:hypothetical protein